MTQKFIDKNPELYIRALQHFGDEPICGCCGRDIGMTEDNLIMGYLKTNLEGETFKWGGEFQIYCVDCAKKISEFMERLHENKGA